MYPFPILSPLGASLSRCLIPALFLLAAGLPANAQESESNRVNLRFLSFPKSMQPVELELRLSQTETEPFRAYSHECSQRIQVVSPGVWSVGETVEGPDGEETFVEYGRTPAANSQQQLLLLIRKGADNTDGFDLIALDESDSVFGGGHFLFMNACKVDIAGKVGDEKFVLRPGRHNIIEPETDEGKQSAHAMFYFRKGEEARPFFSSRWPVNERARSMVFFYHDPKSRRIRMHTVRDFR